jgi:hypothetical protein
VSDKESAGECHQPFHESSAKEGYPSGAVDNIDASVAVSNDKSLHRRQVSCSPDGKRIAAFWFHGPGTVGIYSFDTRNSLSHRMGPGLYPRGWSGDGRYIYYQWPQSPIIYRIESDKPKQTPVIILKPPFREAQCFPMGASLPNAFVCAAFDFASDIWRIDNFEHRR